RFREIEVQQQTLATFAGEGTLDVALEVALPRHLFSGVALSGLDKTLRPVDQHAADLSVLLPQGAANYAIPEVDALAAVHGHHDAALDVGCREIEVKPTVHGADSGVLFAGIRKKIVCCRKTLAALEGRRDRLHSGEQKDGVIEVVGVVTIFTVLLPERLRWR